MLQIQVNVPEDRLDLIFGHIKHCNQFPVEMSRSFQPGELNFFGVDLALNQRSNLYEGLALFFEPSDGKKQKACIGVLDFSWLLYTLLEITGKEIKYVAYANSVAQHAERPGFNQQAVHCCGHR
jgi:hypothetical protein